MLSIDIIHDILAIGSDNLLSLYDLKNMKGICCYDSAHSTEVTSVKFFKEGTTEVEEGPLLLSGGDDGIINLFSVKNGLDEDSVLTMINSNQAINNLSFLDKDTIDYKTNLETYTIFNLETYSNFFEFDAKNVRLYHNLPRRLITRIIS